MTRWEDNLIRRMVRGTKTVAEEREVQDLSNLTRTTATRETNGMMNGSLDARSWANTST